MPTAVAHTSEAARAAKRRVSRRGPINLLAMLAPAILFPVGLALVRDHPRYTWLREPARYPWQLWTVAICGTLATIGGTLDWLHHRSGDTAVGRAEHLSHRAALAGGGLPLFFLMAAASVADRPTPLLLPILLVALFTTVMICHDEFRFHARCAPFETLTHRLLVFGNGVAWLAWMHWCFARA